MNKPTNNLLAELMHELYLNPDNFPAEVDILNEPPKELKEREPVFTWYCNKVIDLIRIGKVSIDDLRETMFSANQLTGPNTEYVLDLLRVAANQFDDSMIQAEATERFLRLLLERYNSDFNAAQLATEGEERNRLLRRSKRIADRALEAIEATDTKIEPDLHSEVLLAKGQAIHAMDVRRVRETVEYYQQALKLKRKAGNTKDVKRLIDLFWREIDKSVINAIGALRIGGIGESIDNLEACANSAEDLDNPERALEVRLRLATVQRQVSQYKEAELNFNHIIHSSSNPDIISMAEFELASVFSETGRAVQAALLQEKLLKDEPSRSNPTLWSNYANSLRLLNRLTEARNAFYKAWSLLPSEQKETRENIVPEEGIRIKMLTADIEQRLGNNDEALKNLLEAEDLEQIPHGITGLHFYSIKAATLLALNKMQEGLDCLERADHLRRQLLSRGPSLSSWESMLRNWSHLDVRTVRTFIEHNDAGKAFLRSESTKGRIVAWLEHWIAPKAAESALDLKRQEKALQAAQQWLQEQQGRRIISLFAADSGMGIFDLTANQPISNTWLEDFDYSALRVEAYEPWERVVESAMGSGEPEKISLASTLTEYLLDVVGTLLWRAAPDLVKGGKELVIIPHRLFRSLPMLHAKLPTGRRLSELFGSIIMASRLTDFLREAPQTSISSDRIAMADPDYSLPFARCEALLSGDKTHRFIGETVTKKEVVNAFGRENPLLISLHGDFNEKNPFLSRIFAADEPLELYELMRPGTKTKVANAILGICEAGRSRRSISDEPFSFPTLLQQGGVARVAAPSWRVDDFASFFYITRLLELLDEDNNLEQSIIKASYWLRSLTATQTLERLDYLLGRLQEQGEEGKNTLTEIMPHVEQQRAWLHYLKPTTKPFHSPLFWAAYQVFGSPHKTD
jgi:tetratricopeptide (TPR) repeat protein